MYISVSSISEDPNNNNISCLDKGTVSKKPSFNAEFDKSSSSSSNHCPTTTPNCNTANELLSNTLSNGLHRTSSKHSPYHPYPSRANNNNNNIIAKEASNSFNRSIKMANKQTNKSKSSFSIFVFLIELLAILCLAAFAAVLRYTDVFKVVKRPYICSDSFCYQKDPDYKQSISFTNASENALYLIILFSPIGLVIIIMIECHHY